MKTHWDRVCGKKFQIFCLWVAFLTKYFTALYKGFWWSAKSIKIKFFEFRSFRLRGLEGRSGIRISWFDPKWHPKSLVLISYTCWRYNPHGGEVHVLLLFSEDFSWSDSLHIPWIEEKFTTPSNILTLHLPHIMIRVQNFFLHFWITVNCYPVSTYRGK